MAAEERKPLFTSEAANTLISIGVGREPVYRTPTKKGRITPMWVGSPMHVDGEGDGDVLKERKGPRKSISDLFGSPMRVDRPRFSVEIPVRNRRRGRPAGAL
jgi:hypothetical protein